MPGLFKIGRARKPSRRVAAANTWCPVRGFSVVAAVPFRDAFAAERAAHRRLRDVRQEGSEWFHPREGTHPINMLRGLARKENNL